MVIKDVNQLVEPFRSQFLRFWAVLTADLKIDALIHETLRSRSRQLAVFQAGASKNQIGKHEFGRAVDIGIYVDGAYQKDDKLGLYLKAGFLGMAFGFRWGGNWDRDKNMAEPGESDLGHFEDATVSVEQLSAGLDT